MSVTFSDEENDDKVVDSVVDNNESSVTTEQM